MTVQEESDFTGAKDRIDDPRDRQASSDANTARHTAGKRKLHHFDQYALLVLLYLLNPVVSSLRAFQQASELQTVQERLGVQRTSLGSLSEAASSVFDAQLLKPVIDGLGSQLQPLAGQIKRGEGTGVVSRKDLRPSHLFSRWKCSSSRRFRARMTQRLGRNQFATRGYSMSTQIQGPVRAAGEVPPLCNGDRLTRAEFERRYKAMPDVKAELIEGVVYMASPVTADDHGEPHFDFNGWLFTYRVYTPGVRGGDNSTLILDLDNEPQPDGYLRLLEEWGGQSRIVEGYLQGAPELIAEVSASSVSYDLHDKLNAYRRNGVREYIVWRVWDKAVSWYVLRDGLFQPLLPDEHGIFRSEVFPGLWLDGAAVVSQNMRRVLDVLNEGIASTPHQEFVKTIQTSSPES